jgi:putative heme iron utilization protein
LETDPFPSDINGNPLSKGVFVLRTITSTKERKLFRFSADATWEEIDLNYLLVNTILNVENKLFDTLSDDALPENFQDRFDFVSIKNNTSFNILMKQQFSQYVKDNNIQTPFLLSNKFKQNNSFTWNYLHKIYFQV